MPILLRTRVVHFFAHRNCSHFDSFSKKCRTSSIRYPEV